VLGVGGARLAQYFLDAYGYPNGYALCFAACLGLLFVSVIPLRLIREPEEIARPPERALVAYLRSAADTLREHRDFSLFVLAQVLAIFHYVALAFYTVYAKGKFGLGAGQAAAFTAPLMAASTVGYLAWGLLGDRRGMRDVVMASFVFAVLAAGAALGAPSPGTYYLVFIFAGLANTGYEIASMNIVLEFAPRGRSALYTSLSATLTAPFRAVLPILGGMLADQVGFAPLFVACGASCLAGAGILSRVRDPRHASGAEEVT